MIKPIDATALKTKLRERLQNYENRSDDFGIGRCVGMTEAMEIADAVPAIDAIPLEWLRKQQRITPNIARAMGIDALLMLYQRDQEAQDE